MTKSYKKYTFKGGRADRIVAFNEDGEKVYINVGEEGHFTDELYKKYKKLG